LNMGEVYMKRPLALRIAVIANALVLAGVFVGCLGRQQTKDQTICTISPVPIDYNQMKGPIIPTVSPPPPPNIRILPPPPPIIPTVSPPPHIMPPPKYEFIPTISPVMPPPFVVPPPQISK